MSDIAANSQDVASARSPKVLAPNIFGSLLSEEISWTGFAAFPPQARFAVLVGNPSVAGPYVVRVRLPGGTKMMPHMHKEDRIYTVISGVFYIGRGDRDRLTKITREQPRSFRYIADSKYADTVRRWHYSRVKIMVWRELLIRSFNDHGALQKKALLVIKAFPIGAECPVITRDLITDINLSARD